MNQPPEHPLWYVEAVNRIIPMHGNDGIFGVGGDVQPVEVIAHQAIMTPAARTSCAKARYSARPDVELVDHSRSVTSASRHVRTVAASGRLVEPSFHASFELQPSGRRQLIDSEAPSTSVAEQNLRDGLYY